MIIYLDDDPRSMRELIKLINTGELQIGADEVRLDGAHQWTMGHPPLHVITVITGYPPVMLTPRLYDVLYGIADGKKASQIAQEMGIACRTVYEYTALLKERFGVQSKEELIVKAMEIGILAEEPP
jgi:DNA-binding NarL/FixJ family response regulator